MDLIELDTDFMISFSSNDSLAIFAVQSNEPVKIEADNTFSGDVLYDKEAVEYKLPTHYILFDHLAAFQEEWYLTVKTLDHSLDTFSFTTTQISGISYYLKNTNKFGVISDKKL